MSEPRTETGRALLAWELAVGAEAVDAERVMDARLGPGWEMRDAIRAIEAEARADTGELAPDREGCTCGSCAVHGVLGDLTVQHTEEEEPDA